MDEHEIIVRLALVARGERQVDPNDAMWAMVADRASRSGLDPAAECANRSHLPPIEALLDLMVANGPYPDVDIETLRAHPHGIDLGPLTPRIPEVLKTPSGTIEVASPPIMADLPRLVELLEQRPTDELLLVGRRHLRSNNSWMHNLEVLVKGRTRCTLQIHPDDASARALTHGGAASITSSAGSVQAVVEVTDHVAPGTVSLPHGWGHTTDGAQLTIAARTTGVNSNELTDDVSIDPLSGNARLNAIPVTVAPAPV
jgi:anaerobic selenocysteine-containing dehydrogenase